MLIKDYDSMLGLGSVFTKYNGIVLGNELNKFKIKIIEHDEQIKELPKMDYIYSVFNKRSLTYNTMYSGDNYNMDGFTAYSLFNPCFRTAFQFSCKYTKEDGSLEVYMPNGGSPFFSENDISNRTPSNFYVNINEGYINIPQCQSLDGFFLSGCYVHTYFNDRSELSRCSEVFSISYSVKFPELTKNSVLFSMFPNGKFLSVRYNGLAYSLFYSDRMYNGVSCDSSLNNVNIDSDKFYNISVVFRSDKISAYINGIKIGEINNQIGKLYTDVGYESTAYIGAESNGDLNWTGSNARSNRVLLKSVYLYKCSITELDIKKIMRYDGIL